MSGSESTSGASLNGADRTDAIVDNIAALVPKHAKISCSTGGDNTIVAAVAGKRIRVVAYLFGVHNTQQVTWKSGAITELSGQMAFAQYGGVSAPLNKVGHFQTASGEALVMNLGQGVQVSGHLTYIEVHGS